MITDPRLLPLVACAGIVATEFLCYRAQVTFRLVTVQAAQLVIRLAIRLSIFTVLGVRLTVRLEQLHTAIGLLNSIMQ